LRRNFADTASILGREDNSLLGIHGGQKFSSAILGPGVLLSVNEPGVDSALTMFLWGWESAGVEPTPVFMVMVELGPKLFHLFVVATAEIPHCRI